MNDFKYCMNGMPKLIERSFTTIGLYIRLYYEF